MFKDALSIQQPVVYKTLYNGLKKERLSHCYLFSGQKGTLKKETALFLAQSIICENKTDLFACQECMDCIRIKENNYVDLIYLDGSNSTIKVDDINNLQNQFRKTALEKAGKKIFIINDCENMTLKASNSLLKFIEEPVGSITGIFITSNISNVLPTIVSRCQTINFKPLNKEVFFNQAKEKNIDDLNAHLLSYLVNDVSQLLELSSSNSYTSAVYYFTEFMSKYFENEPLASIFLQESKLEPITKKAFDKSISKEIFSYFLNIASIFSNDVNNNVIIDDRNWLNLLEKAKSHNFNSINFLKIVIETKDALKTNTNLLLLVDQFIYKLREEL